MRLLKGFGKWFFRFMVIFSFIVNIILVVVLLVLGILIFDIMDNIANPLVGGLHSTAVGLDEATIDWTIPVRDTIPVVLNIQLDTDTTVVLTAPVPLTVRATIDLPGINAYGVDANVQLDLPAGLELPVHLNLPVPVEEDLDIALDVRAVIPLSETQLHDPFETLGLLFEPLAIGLHNLPSDFGEAVQLVSKVLGGETIYLDATDGTGPFNDEPYRPWPGYSITAGENYDLFTVPPPSDHVRTYTGIIPLGGIPALDEGVPRRGGFYANDGNPLMVNEQARTSMQAQGVPTWAYDGTLANYVNGLSTSQLDGVTTPNAENEIGTGGPTTPTGADDGLGIITPTPTAP